MSKNPDEIYSFYDNFSNSDELVKWMIKRQGAIEDVKVTDSDDNDIVIIVPTMHEESENANHCRNEIFNGMRIVFVTSGYDNFNFNYAYSCNIGVKKALEYDPKWIVLSNDDMVAQDPPEKLKEQLSNLENQESEVVFTGGTDNVYHSYPVMLGESSIVRNSYLRISGPDNKKQVLLEKKFGIEIVPSTNFNKKGIFRKSVKFTNIGSFGIFSSDFIRDNNSVLFDEVYLNEFEEVELSYKIFREKRVTSFIDYKIGDKVGTSLGTGAVRKFRAIASRAYFNYKVKHGLFDLSWEK